MCGKSFLDTFAILQGIDSLIDKVL